jgi:hypothetical protein
MDSRLEDYRRFRAETWPAERVRLSIRPDFKLRGSPSRCPDRSDAEPRGSIGEAAVEGEEGVTGGRPGEVRALGLNDDRL